MASLLHSCKSLREGKLAHHYHIFSSFPSPFSCPSPAADTDTVFLHNLLIKMYARHGSTEDAFSVFSSMPSRDSSSWNLMMRAFVFRGRHGSVRDRRNERDDKAKTKTSSVHQIQGEESESEAERAFFLFEQMKCEGFLPGSDSVATFLLGCSYTSNADKGQQIHSSLVASFNGYLESDKFICNNLIGLYAKDGDLNLCRSAFDRSIHKDTITWTVIASGYAQKNLHEEALSLFHRMKEESLLWDQFCFTTIFSLCSEAEDHLAGHSLQMGKYVHTMILSYLGCGGEEDNGERDVPVGNALLRMYMKCGCKEDVERAFQSMPFKDEISYTTMINSYMMYRDTQSCLAVFRFMQNIGFRLNKITYVSTISSCFSKVNNQDTEQLHVYVINSILGPDVVLETALITMYGRCGKADISRRVFDRMIEMNVCTWNAMIMAFSQLEDNYVYMNHLQAQMMQEGTFADKITFVTMISIVSIDSIHDGKRMHASIVGSAFECDMSLANALLNMYGKCGLLEEVFEILNNMLQWDMITFINVLSACSHPKALRMGKFIHGCIVDCDCKCDGIGIVNALMSMYYKCGCFHEVCKVFENALERDNVSWSILILANVEYGYEEAALCLFSEMHKTGLASDKVVLLTALSACARLRRETSGKSIHTLITVNMAPEDDLEIGNALIDMYSKCGALPEAKKTFEMTLVKDAVIWASIISAYAQHGQTSEALSRFIQMKQEGMIASSGTLVSLLSGCIDEEMGGDYLSHCVQVITSGFQSDMMMGTALVSMFGRAGHLGKAMKAFDSISTQTAVSCNAMITVFGQHGRGHLALELMGRMQIQGLMLNSVTIVGLLSACSHDGLLNEACHLVNYMRVCEEVTANLDHYNCIFDLLRRAGQLDVLKCLFINLPFQPNFISWMTFMGGGCEYWDDMLQDGLISHAVELDN